MRFLNSLRNSVLAFAGQIITIFFGFAVRWVFIHNLGQEYLGVNSVMESILMLLSMTELGFGTSVAFALYKPVDKDDKKKIGALMGYYRRVYHVIGVLTAVLGIFLVPFMLFFIKDASTVSDINLIYVMFLANTVLSYFFSYKRTLLSAYQKHYITTVYEDLFAIVKYILQAAVLVLLKNYVLFLAINLICGVAANIAISVKCDRLYPQIKSFNKEKLTPEDKSLLKKSVISLMYQKIGGKLVTGTDNLMISYVNIALMGVYSNYSLVIGIIERVIENVVKSIKGSFGNLMVQKDSSHKYSVYEEFVFLSFCCFFFISSVLSGCLERFIGLLAGKDWILNPLVTFAVVLNFYLQGTRHANIAVIDSAGLFNKLRPKAVFEVLVNLVVSFVFLIVLDMGIYGVLFGTTVSKIGVCIWWEAWAVHKYAFSASFGRYTLKYLVNLLIASAGCFASYFLSARVAYDGIGGLFLTGIISACVSVAIILCVYCRSGELRRLISRFIKKA